MENNRLKKEMYDTSLRWGPSAGGGRPMGAGRVKGKGDGVCVNITEVLHMHV
jgi:hypothetical protein